MGMQFLNLATRAGAFDERDQTVQRFLRLDHLWMLRPRSRRKLSKQRINSSEKLQRFGMLGTLFKDCFRLGPRLAKLGPQFIQICRWRALHLREQLASEGQLLFESPSIRAALFSASTTRHQAGQEACDREHSHPPRRSLSFHHDLAFVAISRLLPF